MAGGRKSGHLCSTKDKYNVTDGTSCLQESPKPGPIGLSTGGDQSGKHWGTFFGHTKSLLISLLDLLPLKQKSPFSTALLRNYVEGSVADYSLAKIGEIPVEWQDWIVKATGGGLGMHRDVNPYNSGLYDLRNSLGHFNVEVKANKDKTKTYSISDVYEFGFKKNDTAQRGRHGFPIGKLNDWELSAARLLLPGDEYENPGGFKERWEIKTVGEEYILFIPQQFLAQQGKPFRVNGSFAR